MLSKHQAFISTQKLSIPKYIHILYLYVDQQANKEGNICSSYDTFSNINLGILCNRYTLDYFRIYYIKLAIFINFRIYGLVGT